MDGAALQAARRRKERRYAELARRFGRARLVVLAVEVCGRWSQETFFFEKKETNKISSNSDAANARAAVQASVVDHRSSQACSALFRNAGVSERARAAARRQKSRSFSPPTSSNLSCQDNQFCSAPGANQLVVCTPPA